MTISNVGSVTNMNQPVSTDGFSQLFTDFKGVGSAIQSGDLTTAQSALTSFLKDLQSNTGRNPLSQLFKNNSTLSTDLNALQTALKSNDAAGAQNAFKTLLQDMQSAMRTQGTHHHHHHHRVHNKGDNEDQSSSSTTSSSSSASGSTAGSSSTGSTLDVQA